MWVEPNTPSINQIQLHNMATTAKISPIKKEYSSSFSTFESSLAKAGFPRSPGSTRMMFPFKEISGKYRTGLDVEATYLFKLSVEDREAEIKRITETKERLEKKTGFDLGPKSQYYNYSADLPDEQKISPVKLGTQDKFFDLLNPLEEIAWNWIRVHPSIAPSLGAYRRKEVHPDMVQYYVADDEAEDTVIYNKKMLINKAIGILDTMDLSKRKKIARLMGLPVTDDSKESVVYNLMDNLLKQGEFLEGEHKGSSTINIFNDFVKMNEARLHIKDIVNQIITHGIYRVKIGGKVFEGDNEISTSKDTLVNFLLEDSNQDELMALEKRLSIKKYKTE